MRAVSVPGAEPSKPSAQRKNVRSRSRLSRNRRYDMDIENGPDETENAAKSRFAVRRRRADAFTYYPAWSRSPSPIS